MEDHTVDYRQTGAQLKGSVVALSKMPANVVNLLMLHNSVTQDDPNGLGIASTSASTLSSTFDTMATFLNVHGGKTTKALGKLAGRAAGVAGLLADSASLVNSVKNGETIDIVIDTTAVVASVVSLFKPGIGLVIAIPGILYALDSVFLDKPPMPDELLATMESQMRQGVSGAEAQVHKRFAAKEQALELEVGVMLAGLDEQHHKEVRDLRGTEGSRAKRAELRTSLAEAKAGFMAYRDSELKKISAERDQALIDVRKLVIGRFHSDWYKWIADRELSLVYEFKIESFIEQHAHWDINPVRTKVTAYWKDFMQQVTTQVTSSARRHAGDMSTWSTSGFKWPAAPRRNHASWLPWE
ncbi:hypothetical protein [Streptomyces sp. NPDC058579]|uniref:hypothetical protein n=1 Tax=Streptomyces sp. NPDC058579 TaxID=3346548 RepID=UPI00365F86CD